MSEVGQLPDIAVRRTELQLLTQSGPLIDEIWLRRDARAGSMRNVAVLCRPLHSRQRRIWLCRGSNSLSRLCHRVGSFPANCFVLRGPFVARLIASRSARRLVVPLLGFLLV